MSSDTPTFTSAPSSSPAQQPTIAADPAQVAALPPEQRSSLVETYRRAGFSQAELSRVFGKEAAPVPKLDRHAAAQAQYDASFTGSVDAKSYDLTNVFAGRGASPEDVTLLNQQLTSALSAMQVPKALGPTIAGAFFDSLDSRPENPADLPAWQSEQRRVAEKVGGQSVEELTALAAHALQRVDADTRQLLVESGALDGASAIVFLAQHAQRLKAQGK